MRGSGIAGDGDTVCAASGRDDGAAREAPTGRPGHVVGVDMSCVEIVLTTHYVCVIMEMWLLDVVVTGGEVAI